MHPLNSRPVFIAVLISAIFASVSGGQQTATEQTPIRSDEVIKSRTRLVVVDVVATDAQGRP